MKGKLGAIVGALLGGGAGYAVERLGLISTIETVIKNPYPPPLPGSTPSIPNLTTTQQTELNQVVGYYENVASLGVSSLVADGEALLKSWGL
jgi:hypothetical protein